MTENPDDGALYGIEVLTARDREILELFSQGLQNRAVATELSIAEETVRSHAKNIYRRLRVRNRTGASTRFAEYSRPYPQRSPVDSPMLRATRKGYPERGIVGGLGSHYAFSTGKLVDGSFLV